ncbi:MAG: PTS sugar transporter subunit IIB [Treponema sp.]|nr:PTS sugar transporter subunit IIB [Treponema sp.]
MRGEEVEVAISMVRIDDRLIHGQVAIGWTKMLNATVIVVADDPVAADPVQKTVLKAATPIGVRSAILGIADAAALLTGPKLVREKVLVVVKGPAPVLDLINAGIDIKRVIIGNMRMEDGKKRITKEVAANETEWKAFRELNDRGVELIAQWLPGGDSKNFNEIIKKEA